VVSGCGSGAAVTLSGYVFFGGSVVSTDDPFRSLTLAVLLAGRRLCHHIVRDQERVVGPTELESVTSTVSR
jgi:hypothetical protein